MHLVEPGPGAGEMKSTEYRVRCHAMDDEQLIDGREEALDYGYELYLRWGLYVFIEDALGHTFYEYGDIN